MSLLEGAVCARPFYEVLRFCSARYRCPSRQLFLVVMVTDSKQRGIGTVSARMEGKILFGVFCAAWLLNVTLSLIGWDNTLLGPFQFRQLQTAMSTLFFPTDGFRLAYEMPLFGPPWSVPLEFPLYQASVAWWANVSGMALDPAGRLVSWLWFQLGLVGVFVLLGALGIERRYRWISLSLLVTSPVYLFYSRAFLIESTVTSLSIWFLAAVCWWLSSGRWRWLVVAALSGAGAAAVKPTTLFGFAVAVGLFYGWRTGMQVVEERRQKLRELGRLLAAFVLPVAVGLGWQVFSAVQRQQNPEAEFLDVMFGHFGFGDMEQRLSFAFWAKLTSDWFRVVVSEAGCGMLVLLSMVIPRQRVWMVGGLLAVFVSSQLVFSNLFFVHEYYQYATGLFLVLGLGVALASPVRGRMMPAWALGLLVVVLVGLQVRSYWDFYLPAQEHNIEPPELVDAVRTVTRPTDMIVVLGHDWDAVVPYYSQRRSLMLVAGRERDPEAIRASVARLDPETVGAFVNRGYLRSNTEWVTATMGRLALGEKPLLHGNKIQTAIWVPSGRRKEADAALPDHPYKTLDVVYDAPKVDGEVVMSAHDIARSSMFFEFVPRPILAASPVGFSPSEVEGEDVVNAHAPTRLVLKAPETAKQLKFKFGLHSSAYLNGNFTDGVLVEVIDQRGEEDAVVFSRYLNPMVAMEDRGLIAAEVDLPPIGAGYVVVRISPGPQNNASCDWAYVGALRMQ